jgi:hypothetical protein
MSNQVSKGTPQNLKQAILNGLLSGAGMDVVCMTDREAMDLSDAVAPHVVDYFAQKFAAAFLQDPSFRVLEELWKATTGRPMPDNKSESL